MMTYAEAATRLSAVQEEVETTSTRLCVLQLSLARQFGVPAEGQFGIVPEVVRAHSDYQFAKSSYDMAFQKLRSINAYLREHHKEEHRRAMELWRDNRRAERLARAA